MEIKKVLTWLIRIILLAVFIVLLVKQKLILWLILFAATLIVAIFFGRIYCGYICPINTLLIPVARVSKSQKNGKRAPNWLKSGKFAWVTLIISGIIFTFTRLIVKKPFPVLLVWLVIAILITLRYQPYVFHNLICPYGILQKMFAGSSRFSQFVEKSNCIGCYQCERVCPAEAVKVQPNKKAEITAQICLQCKECEFVCPTKTICYQKLTD
ncbi:MAG: 4Fe-4S binding protein [Clostridiaceae bacterium]|nr:4Fe-4S binding protein [Clostridiaceae bacterium]